MPDPSPYPPPPLAPAPEFKGAGHPEYRVCARCVMDTTALEIAFDANGVCNFCRQAEARLRPPEWQPDANGARRLEAEADRIREAGKGKEYDCLVGISGGVDSSYTAYQAVKLGLRPLPVHVDTGWNSDLAVTNIQNICRNLGLELHTHVVDWKEMRDLQRAYLKSGVPNQDVPQDHAINAICLRLLKTFDIGFLLRGANHATESILPQSWVHTYHDGGQLLAIHRMFGERALEKYPVLGFEETMISLYDFPTPRPYEIIDPLNLLPYVREQVERELAEAVGFRPYKYKHWESRFTRFYQNHYLIRRYGYDKRRPHFSSLIMSGQMTRDAALETLRQPPYDPFDLEDDTEFFLRKLRLSQAEFDELLAAPPRSHMDYINNAEAFPMVQELGRVKKALQAHWEDAQRNARW